MADDAEAMARAAVDLAATSPLSVDDALRVLAEAARLLEAADIVRGLDASDPLDSTGGCAHCGASLRPETASDTSRHHDSCLWRRAVEWVRDTDQETT